MTDQSGSTDLQYLKGVGPRRAEALEQIGISSIRDLLYYLPRGYLDRSTIVTVADLPRHIDDADPVTIVARVASVEARRSRRTRRMIFMLTVSDATGSLQCVWFEGFQYYKDAFTEGELLALSAFPSRDKAGRIQFVHPQFDRLAGSEEDEPDWGNLFNTGTIIPKYASGADLQKVGLDSRGFRRILRNGVSRASRVPETIDEAIVSDEGLVGLETALRDVHFPESWDDLRKAKERLKFDELFFLNLMVALRKEHQGRVTGRSYGGPSPRRDALLARLPFRLTQSQQRVCQQIDDDMAAPFAMHRLLQGDVGSGKTIVALLSLLRVIDAGAQVAFMAPTEVLAEQHVRTLTHFTEGLDVNVRLLIGNQKKKLREDVLEDIRRGSADIVVGTHALLEETVSFADLGMVVIDEQHRFGVMQRATLSSKAVSPELLVMTATPIPRTLALTVYGDLEVSTIDELPADRIPIRTGVRPVAQAGKAYDFIRQEVAAGRQAYIVFPLIEASEKVDLKAATEEFERLSSEVFAGLRLGLLHGRLPSDAKEEVMERFQRGEVDILVSTTVIEVGIDVPNATVMLIENAERFGLSQLHQLRGRVGRGPHQSYCVLISNQTLFRKKLRGLDEEEKREEEHRASRRLSTMVETSNGFKIAEVDLELRGPGDFFGTRQSGLPALRVADIVHDRDIFERTRERALSIVSSDPHLRDAGHRSIRSTFDRYYHHLFRLGSVS